MRTSFVPELLLPISESRPDIPVDELSNVLAYQALRGLVQVRQQHTVVDPLENKNDWMPSTQQLAAVREQLEPRLPYLMSRKRLINFAGDDANLAQLMPHQADIFSNITRTVASSHEAKDSHTCIIAATGTGKSYLMGTFVQAMHGDKAPESSAPLKTLILTPTNILVDQITEDLSQRLPELPVGNFNMNKKELDKPVTVMTYASFVQQTKQKNLDRGMFDQVLLDEVDLALAPDTRAEVKDFISTNLAFGFTATGVNSEFRDVNHLFTHVIDDYDVKQCIEQGILSPVQVWLVQTGEQLDIGKIKRFNDIPTEKLRELGQRTQRGLLSAKIATDFIASGKKGLIKCPAGDSCSFAIERANQLNTILIKDKDGTSRRVRAAAVGSSIPGSKEIIEAYKAGEYDVLCYVKLIGRGFDDPGTDFLIDESPTLSPVEGTQGPGRTLRYREGKIAHIVHLVDDITSDGRPLNAFTMLHALGAEHYEPGMYFGPTDNWRGKATANPLKKYEHLELFSHEIQAIMKRTGIHLKRMYELGRHGVTDESISLMTKTNLAQKTGLSYSSITNFFERNGIEPLKLGRSGSYDERFIEVLKEHSLIHGRMVNPREHGWIPAYQLEPTLLEEISRTSQIFTPIRHIIKKSSHRLRPSTTIRERFFSPTQWQIITETFLSDVVSGGNMTVDDVSMFEIEGDPIDKINELLDTELDNVTRSNGRLREKYYKLSGLINLNFPYGSDEYKAAQAKQKEREASYQQFAEAMPKLIKTRLHTSPLFQQLRDDQTDLQQHFDEAQTSAGTKDRIILDRFKTYGRFVNAQESQAIHSYLARSVATDVLQSDKYGRYELRSIDDITPDHTIDVKSALKFVFSMLSSYPDWEYPETAPENIMQVATDLFDVLAHSKPESTLLTETSYSRTSYRFQQTVKLTSFIDALTKVGEKHGIGIAPSIASEIRNLEIQLDNPLVAKRRYLDHALGPIVHQ